MLINQNIVFKHTLEKPDQGIPTFHYQPFLCYFSMEDNESGVFIKLSGSVNVFDCQAD